MASSSQQSVSHVTVKAPQFYRKSPETWFRQLESQFALAGITNNVTKYHHTLTALPEDIACDIGLDGSNYDELKTAVLDMLKANRHLLIEEALAAVELGDRRPTQLVMDIKRKFNEVGLQADDSIIKSRLITALPSTVRSALVGHDNVPLDNFAKIADSMLAVMGRESPFVAQVGQASREVTKSWNSQNYAPR